MSDFNPMRALPKNADYGPSDTLVVFGEVFSRGYVNGIIEEAERKGMKVIYTTVGRRDSENKLRPLTPEEVKDKKQSPLINVPLEAGFDLLPWKSGETLVDQLSRYKMSQWSDITVDKIELEEIIKKSQIDFKKRTMTFLEELKKELPKKGHLVFAHTMAGGIPRAKIVMPVVNRIFKGSGERYQSSEEFVSTDLGHICMKSFDEVTANTFQMLIDCTESLRKEREQEGFRVGYTAFGYHGCDALVGDDYIWQSYAPYLQGWAKVKLENIAIKAFKNNISASVFNAPEILTDSSSVFLGVEVCLYPLLSALKKEGLSKDHQFFKNCESKIKSEFSIKKIEDFVQDYLDSDATKMLTEFKTWPHHNKPNQMEKMKSASQYLMDMHKDKKELITSNLSELVFKACGALMLNEIYNLEAPVWWVGHDIVSKWTVKSS